jgi:hypothetical protein
MHFPSPSLSVTALSFFLTTTYAQASCHTTVTIHGISEPSETTAPQHTSSSHDASQAGCLVTVTEHGIPTVINLCSDVTTTPLHPRPRPLPQCLTTVKLPDGQVVVVNCGEAFASGNHPKTTPTAPASTPITTCIEDGCYEIIGTFGSATSTTAAPAQAYLKDEL